MPNENSSAPLLGDLAQRIILDAIRSAYDTGYNDSRLAKSVPGDSAPGYEGRNIEADHGGALIARLNQLIAAPQPQVEPAGDRETFEKWASGVGFDTEHFTQSPIAYSDATTEDAWGVWQASRPALANTQPAAADHIADTGNMVQVPAGEYPALPAGGYALDYDSEVTVYDADQMRAYADATHAMRSDLQSVETAAFESSVGHLSALVDEQREQLERAKNAMTAIHNTARPADESIGDMDAIIPYDVYARFVDEHAALIHATANSPVAMRSGEQEPQHWVLEHNDPSREFDYTGVKAKAEHWRQCGQHPTPLYTSPVATQNKGCT
ncbi:MAG: hypothetical protein RSD57_12380 [Comamonas sp.]